MSNDCDRPIGSTVSTGSVVPSGPTGLASVDRVLYLHATGFSSAVGNAAFTTAPARLQASENIGELVAEERRTTASRRDLSPEPPAVAEFLIGLFANNRRYGRAILSDLDEDFQNDIESGMTMARARRRYRSAALKSMGPQLCAAVKRTGIVGILIHYVRLLLH